MRPCLFREEGREFLDVQLTIAILVVSFDELLQLFLRDAGSGEYRQKLLGAHRPRLVLVDGLQEIHNVGSATKVGIAEAHYFVDIQSLTKNRKEHQELCVHSFGLNKELNLCGMLRFYL